MSDELRQKTMEGWQQAKADKLERRRQNREKWAQRRDWSDDNQQTLDTGNIPQDTNGNTSASLQQLRDIMTNSGVPLFRRLDAAEVLLTYELGPAAAVGADPEQIASVSYRFLKSVVDNNSTPEALRFRALKSIVAVENARASVKSTAAEYQAKRELLCRLIVAERQSALRTAGRWAEAVNIPEHGPSTLLTSSRRRLSGQRSVAMAGCDVCGAARASQPGTQRGLPCAAACGEGQEPPRRLGKASHKRLS
jgi:hypothetical protein